MSFPLNMTEYVEKHSKELRITFIATVTINIIFGLTAIVLNSIVVIAMAKNVSLRTPSNALLFCLSLSDLGVGLFSQALYVFWKLDWLLNPATQNYELFYNLIKVSSSYFSAVSFLTMSEVSMERYLCLHYHLRYEAMATVRRVLTAALLPWVFCAVLIGIDHLFNGFFLYCSIIIMPLCIIQSLVCYVTIFAVLKRHHNQINTQFLAAQTENSLSSNVLQCREPSQVSSEIATASTHQKPASGDTNTRQRLTRFRKSATSMSLLFLFLLLCYIPYFVVQAVGRMKITLAWTIARNFSSTLVYINSSINPVLYCYKISTIRNAIKDLLLRRRNGTEN